jgi:hypothetical protein
VRHHARVSTLAALAVVFVAGCGSKEKPDAFIHAATDAANGKPQAIWQELPPSYQKDAKELIATFATKMDPKLWDDGFAIAKKAIKVAQQQRQFILANPMLQQLQVTPEAYDATLKILSTVSSSEVSTHAGLKTLDVEKFLSGTMAVLMDDIAKAGAVAAKATTGTDLSSQLAKAKKMKTSVESVAGDKAKVKIEMEGEAPQVLDFVKVEGKWIPQALAEGWPKAMQSAKAALADFKVEPQTIAAVGAAKTALDAALDKLLAAKTADEFNTELAMAMQALRPSASPAVDTATPSAADEKPAAQEDDKKGKAPKGKKVKAHKK